MKTVAYALYVVIVLLISGLARANAMPIKGIESVVQTQYQSPAKISQVVFDASKSELVVAGSLPNPCFGNPSAMLTQDSSNPSVLVLRLSSPIPMDACISRVKFFTANVELAKLIQVSHVKLDSGANYTLKVEGSEFELPIAGSSLVLAL